jgi:uncharacterized protein YxjI
MKYPVDLTFKILALAPQISVTDADGQLRMYVKQKLFKLKEDVTVFADEDQRTPIYKIKADRVIDWNARYRFTDMQGNDLGSVKRSGMKSLWRVHYEIMRGEEVVMTIREENPWIKVIDGLVGEVPVLGPLITGYILHPAYRITRNDGTLVMRAVKRAAFLQGRFRLEEKVDLPEDDEVRVVLSVIMMLLLQRMRG